MIGRLYKFTRSLSLATVSCHSPQTRLTNWIKHHGAYTEGVRTGKSSVSENGLFTTKDLMKGDLVMSLPMNLTVMVYPHDKENAIQLPESSLPDTVIRLAAKLLRLLREDDEGVKLYADALPRDLPNPSTMFSCIASNDIYRHELERIVKYYENTVAFMKQLNLPGGVTEEDIRWALAVIQSRSFGNGLGQEMVVPLIDIMNHGDLTTNELFTEEPLANVTYGWSKSGRGTNPVDWKMIIKAKNTILEGEELFVSYGDHSNEYFLLYYGFVPFHNPRDEFVLFNNLEDILTWFFQQNPQERGTITTAQLEVLKHKLRLTGEMADIVRCNICADGSISPIMLDFFKLLCHGSESEALKWISLACQERLDTSTSLQEDLSLLSGSSSQDPSSIFTYHYEKLGSSEARDSTMTIPVYKSKLWWATMHGALKKWILHDNCPV